MARRLVGIRRHPRAWEHDQQTVEFDPYPTLAEASQKHLTSLAARGVSSEKQAWYQTVENRFMAFIDENCERDATTADLTVDKAEEWVGWLRTSNFHVNPISGQVVKRSDRSVRDHVSSLKTWSKYLAKREITEKDSLATLDLPNAPDPTIKPPTPAQLKHFLDTISASREAPRNLAMIMFIMSSGVRVSEMCRLDREFVDLQDRRVLVVGKGAHGPKERWVHIDEPTAVAVQRYLDTRDDIHPSLFIVNGKRAHRNMIWQMVSDYGRRTGIRGIRWSPHTLPRLRNVLLRAASRRFVSSSRFARA